MSSQGRRSFPLRFLERVRARVLHGNEAVRRMLDRSRTLLEAEGVSLEDTSSASSDAWVSLPDEFATVTMAKILSSQGRRDEAIAVLQRVIEREPGHHEAQALLREVSQSEVTHEAPRGTHAKGAHKEPTSMLDREAPPERYNSHTLRALAVDPRTLVLFWEFAGEPEAPLCIDIVSYMTRNGEEIAEHRFLEDVPTVGNLFVRKVEPGTIHHVSLGWLREGMFVTALEAEPVSTPRGKPAQQLVDTRATLILPPRAPQAALVSTPWVVVERFVAAPESNQPPSLVLEVPAPRGPDETPAHYELAGAPVRPRIERTPIEHSATERRAIPVSNRQGAQRTRVPHASSSDVWYEEFEGEAPSSDAWFPTSSA